MKFRIFLVTCTALYSCSRPNDTRSASGIQPIRIAIDSVTNLQPDIVEKVDTTNIDYNGYDKLESYITMNAIKEGIETIDFDCAIVIYPNDAQVDEMIKKEGTEDFYTGADDSNFYQGMAMKKIDSMGIRTLTVQARFLKLKGKEKTWNLDVRKKNLPAWNLIFFKKTKTPKIISTIDVTAEEIEEYFKKGE